MGARDGTYYAKGVHVFRRPLQSPTGTQMGFRVCTLADGVGHEGAQEIADALNAAESKRQWDDAIVANREEHEA